MVENKNDSYLSCIENLIERDEEFITIDINPTWSAATRVYLEVLRVNEWWSEPSKRAREELQRMAQGMDNIQQYAQGLQKELKE